jgi:hypothetical protein
VQFIVQLLENLFKSVCPKKKYIMANLHLSFTFKDAAFCLCATVNGTSKRNYEKVLNMVNPNFDVWDNKKQRFNEPTNEAITNNRRLDEMKKNYQYLIDTFNTLIGKELFSLFKNAEKVEAKKEITLGEYLKTLILNLKGRTHNRLPSANHQVYTTLLHKLKKENSIIDVPLVGHNLKF